MKERIKIIAEQIKNSVDTVIYITDIIEKGTKVLDAFKRLNTTGNEQVIKDFEETLNSLKKISR